MNTITSMVMVQESGMPSPMQTHGSPFWEGSPGATSASASVSASASGVMADDASMISGSTMLTSTMTTTRIQLLMRCSSMISEMLHLDASPSLQKRGDKVGKGKEK